MAKEFKSFYKTVSGNEGNKCNYPTRLDTYGCGCSHDCAYCLSPDTEILMADNTIKYLRDVEVGDEVIGVAQGETYKYYTKALVLNKWSTHKAAYKITLQNGVELICSGDHRWLTNRGWKYTTGKMSGKGQRPYITIKNKIAGFGTWLNGINYDETKDYKTGYLAGCIQGDGSMGAYTYTRWQSHVKPVSPETQYHFRLVMKDTAAVQRVKRYLFDFGITTNDFDFAMIERATKEVVDYLAIRTHSKDAYFKILALVNIEGEKSKEWYRGFLAGIYDAEGYGGSLIKRLYNTDERIVDKIVNGLRQWNFDYTFDKDKVLPSKKVLKTIRILGGLGVFERFVLIMQPAIKRKFEIEGIALKNSKSPEMQIVSIEPYSDGMDLIDITTTTENFIANGCVSHNCYAKSLLDFRKLWNPTDPAVADIDAIRKKIAKLDPNMPAIRLGGMTDCFQPIEKVNHVTYETIKALNARGIEYLIVTKSAIVADDEYMAILDKDLAHIQISVTTTDDERSLSYEKASVPSERIAAIEKLYAAGYDVQLRLSPFIPEYIDFDILNAVKCDKILVEFLRVNTWIRKWFDIDYSDYILKQSGYNHLPLDKKLEYISKITGFKEVTVCEDESGAYDYWKHNFNPNPDDCCNLRKKATKCLAGVGASAIAGAGASTADNT